MNYSAELDAIDAIFTPTALGVTNVLHENQKYDGDSSEWVRISSQTADGQQKSLGNNPVFRYTGVCYVQIFVKPDTGSGRAIEIADVVTSLVRGQRISGIQFFVPKVVRIGEKDGWYQVNVSTKYYRED